MCVLCLPTSEEVCISRLESLRGPPQQLLVQGPDPVVPVLVVQPTEEEAVVTHLEPNTQEQGIIQLPKHNTKRTHARAHARMHTRTHTRAHARVIKEQVRARASCSGVVECRSYNGLYLICAYKYAHRHTTDLHNTLYSI